MCNVFTGHGKIPNPSWVLNNSYEFSYYQNGKLKFRMRLKRFSTTCKKCNSKMKLQNRWGQDYLLCKCGNSSPVDYKK